MKTNEEIEKMIQRACNPEGSGLEDGCFGSCFEEGVINALRWVLEPSELDVSKIAEEKMEESKYPVKEMRDRAASASSGICPECGALLVEVDGSLMHSLAALGCSREECSYICM